MKIAFAVDGPEGLDSVVSYHFGRSPYFVIVTLDEGGEVTGVEIMENPFISSHSPGDVPRLFLEKGVSKVVAGGIGVKAKSLFNESGIEVITGVYGKVKDVIHEIEVERKEEEHVGGRDEISRIKLEVQALRKNLADLKSLLLNLQRRIEKLEKDT